LRFEAWKMTTVTKLSMLPTEIEALIDEGPVALDADGTLWEGDVGDELVRDLGRFAEYEALLKKDAIAGYTWAVSILEGLAVDEVRARCERLFERQRVFDFVRPFLALVPDVYIVSASPVWAVEAGARALSVPLDRVIAVDAPVKNGIIGRVEEPIPCGEGKVHHLKKRGIRPSLAFGNGELDAPMLAFSRRGVVVAPRQGPENGLVRLALQCGWSILRA
jgi:phosphoserine phosphatase